MQLGIGQARLRRLVHASRFRIVRSTHATWNGSPHSPHGSSVPCRSADARAAETMYLHVMPRPSCNNATFHVTCRPPATATQYTLSTQNVREPCTLPGRATAHQQTRIRPTLAPTTDTRNRDVNDPAGRAWGRSRAPGPGSFTSRFPSCAVGTAVRGGTERRPMPWRGLRRNSLRHLRLVPLVEAVPVAV